MDIGRTGCIISRLLLNLLQMPTVTFLRIGYGILPLLGCLNHKKVPGCLPPLLENALYLIFLPLESKCYRLLGIFIVRVTLYLDN